MNVSLCGENAEWKRVAALKEEWTSNLAFDPQGRFDPAQLECQIHTRRVGGRKQQMPGHPQQVGCWRRRFQKSFPYNGNIVFAGHCRERSSLDEIGVQQFVEDRAVRSVQRVLEPPKFFHRFTWHG